MLAECGSAQNRYEGDTGRSGWPIPAKSLESTEMLNARTITALAPRHPDKTRDWKAVQ